MVATQSLPALVDRARTNLSEARTAAEVLDARDQAAMAYDAAKRAARLLAARNAYDELIPRIHRAQADALLIESEAKRRLADEYDAAQERGEVAKAGDNQHNKEVVPSGNDLGLSRKAIHEARQIRNAEAASPGVVERAVEAALAEGAEPSKARLRKAVEAANGKAPKKEHSLKQTERIAGRAPTRAELKRAAADAAGRATGVRRRVPQRGSEAIRAKVYDAVQALYGLPPAAEVAGWFGGDDRSLILNERLPEAARWLAELAQIWRRSDA